MPLSEAAKKYKAKHIGRPLSRKRQASFKKGTSLYRKPTRTRYRGIIAMKDKGDITAYKINGRLYAAKNKRDRRTGNVGQTWDKGPKGFFDRLLG